MRHLGTLIGVITLVLAGPRSQAAPVCALADAETLWIQTALDGWHEVSESLHMQEAPLPWIVLFNASCVWHLMPGDGLPADAASIATSLSFAGSPVLVRGLTHGDKVRLPSDADTPAEPVAFTSMYGEPSAAFFVMAMPDVWRADPRFAGDLNLDRFFLGVLTHEMVHTQHLPLIFKQAQAIADRYKLPDLQLDDDMVQNRFASVRGFSKAFEAERDVFYAAAAESNLGRRKQLTARGLSMMRKRRAHYFTGADKMYAEFEDLCLSLEGAGQWASYRYARAHAPPGASDSAAVDFVRDNRKYWSQEEGLALFLLLDELVPDWQAKVFGPASASPTALLEDALRLPRK